MFRAQMRATALFCGVEILTFSLLDNHVHLLVRVPAEKPELTDGQLLERCTGLYGGKQNSRHALTLEAIRDALTGGGEERERMRRALIGRMCDLSMFAKLLKQRFSIWYNRTHGRHGTLWSGRFTSVLVEGKGLPVAIVAAYIDLNAVRAGIVQDPAQYQWCGFAEASKGVKAALAGIRVLGGCASPAEALARYAVLLYHRGAASGKGKPPDSRVPREVARAVHDYFGSLEPFANLRRRLRHATRGGILGYGEFIESWFAENRIYFGKRRCGARRIRGGDFGGLRSFRDVRPDDLK